MCSHAPISSQLRKNDDYALDHVPLVCACVLVCYVPCSFLTSWPLHYKQDYTKLATLVAMWVAQYYNYSTTPPSGEVLADLKQEFAGDFAATGEEYKGVCACHHIVQFSGVLML